MALALSASAAGQIQPTTPGDTIVNPQIQNRAVNPPKSPGQLAAQHPNNAYLMQKGSVVMMQDSVWVPITDEVALINGMRVGPTGKVTNMDGTLKMMNEGDAVDPEGVWYDAPSNELKPSAKKGNKGTP